MLGAKAGPEAPESYTHRNPQPQGWRDEPRSPEIRIACEPTIPEVATERTRCLVMLVPITILLRGIQFGPALVVGIGCDNSRSPWLVVLQPPSPSHARGGRASALPPQYRGRSALILRSSKAISYGFGSVLPRIASRCLARSTLAA